MAAPRLPIVLLWIACLFTGASAAGADPGDPPRLESSPALPGSVPDSMPTAAVPTATRAARVTEILADLDLQEPDPGWFSLELARMRISGKYGLIYTRDLDGLQLRLRGPRLGRSTNVGLSLELRF